MRLSDKIKLLEHTVFIYERNASDRLALEASLTVSKIDSINFMNQQAVIIRDSLKYNWISLPWYKFYKKWKLKRIFSLKNIINLPQREIIQTAHKILILEGNESPYHKFLLGEISAEKFAESVKKKAEELALLGSMQ